MYYHFRPDYWFWIVVILGRKLMIAVTALMFAKNPGFQMAIALLVLFICYAAQVGVRGTDKRLALVSCAVFGSCVSMPVPDFEESRHSSPFSPVSSMNAPAPE